MYAEERLKAEILKEALEKSGNTVTPQKAVNERSISIRLSRALFSINETCYRYQPKLSDEHTIIADWLMRLAQNQRNWGFGLCFLYFRNVKGYG